MNGIFLIDTNAVIDLNNGDPAITTIVQDATEIYLPMNVLGELYYGAERSLRIEENFEQIKAIAQDWDILPPDLMTARIYGQIRNQLRKKGKPIPENDIWIAALALQHKLRLLTRDKHFNEVDDLKTISW